MTYVLAVWAWLMVCFLAVDVFLLVVQNDKEERREVASWAIWTSVFFAGCCYVAMELGV